MRNLILICLFYIGLFAKSSILSPLPIPESIFIDLTTQKCDAMCLEELAKNEMYFTFLAKYPALKDKDEISKTYKIVSSLFTLKPLEFEYDFSKEGVEVKLAVIAPYKYIKKYATTSVNSIIAYLLARNSAFDIEVFNIEDEKYETLELTLNKIREKGYNVVIAPVTQFGANYLSQNASDLLIYIPTIHNSQILNSTNNVLYGGIDYNAQIETLLSLSNQKIALFSDGSLLGSRLNSLVAQNSFNIVYEKEIVGKKLNLKYMLKGNQILQNSSIFLNMPLVKTSLLSSQLRAYEIEPFALLSTQINYNPILLTLTQHDDIKTLFIANSIQLAPFNIRATNELFKHDIEYDWVNYATNIGLDYLYSSFYSSDTKRAFTEEVNANQIIYNVKIYKPSRFGFYAISE